LRSDFDRFVGVLAVDQAVAADLRLDVRKAAVRNLDVAVANWTVVASLVGANSPLLA
jgi:hypothetical protein